MRSEINPVAQREIERMWQLRREAVEILGAVVFEWMTDPQSVACFDLRLVERAKGLMVELNRLTKKHDTF